MPNNKSQHYVPQMYLRRFSISRKSISLFLLNERRFITGASIKGQCQSDYFYGKDGSVEKSLQTTEGMASKLINEIEKSLDLPEYGSVEYLDMLLWVLVQYARTKISVDFMNDMFDAITKSTLKGVKELRDIDLESFRIENKFAAQNSIAFTLKNHPIAIDLRAKLISNKSSEEFITSDNPVVLLNPYLSFREDHVNTGLASKGLIIIYPLSPKLLLLMYDDTVYSVGGRKNCIEARIPKDIYSLNAVQACSADNCLFSRTEKVDYEALLKNAYPHMEKKISKIHRATVGSPESNRQFVGVSRKEIKYPISLSFLGIKKSAKRFLSKLKKMPYQPLVVKRNETLFQLNEEFQNKIRNNEYDARDFFVFLGDIKPETISQK